MDSKKKYTFLVRQLESWRIGVYEDSNYPEWDINNVWNIGQLKTSANNERKVFTRFLKKNGITFKKNRTLIEFDGDNYTIIDRKTKEPLFDMILINY